MRSDRAPMAERVLVLLSACVVLGCGDDAVAGTAEPVCTRCGACEESVEVVRATHVVGEIDYGDDAGPPAGGDHNECWGRWGVHDAPLAAERWVHNLEHGGIAFLYRCTEGCADEVAALERIVAGRPLALLTSYADMSARFAVVSWGHRLVSDCLDEDALLAFYEAHVDRAPESVGSEPPAGCPP
jgi:Protein of unknown function (DUF3105)